MDEDEAGDGGAEGGSGVAGAGGISVRGAERKRKDYGYGRL